jgi:hypothetical protein
MQFIGVDLHTNKFTCCYRDGTEGKGKKETETFELSDYGIAQFSQTLTSETYVLVEATITTFAFVRIIQPLVKQVTVANTYELKQIGVFTAIAIIADIITVDRFRNSKAFTSYLRSAPKVSNSNTSVSIKGTNKKGRKLAATLVTQSLNHVLDSSPKLRRWYDCLCEYKKPGLVRTGLRRRVFAEMYQMLKKGEYHYGRETHLHEAKISQFKRFLEKRKNLLKIA